MKTTMRCAVRMWGLALILPGVAWGQLVGDGALRCAQTETVPDIGITGLDCVGDCTLTMTKAGKDNAWSFTTEPKILGVREGSPAYGALRAGDRLVALDGVLITTVEGGRRYANLVEGKPMTIRYRRDGRIGEASVLVGSLCETSEPTALVGRVPWVPAPDRAPVPPSAMTAPRVVRPDAPSAATAPTRPLSAVGRATGASELARRPTGTLGVGFSCQQCGMRSGDTPDATPVWFFSGPLEVTDVTPGGPADRAGIRLGDLITAIDGLGVETAAGGAAFGSLTRGQATVVTVVRRDGRSEDIHVVAAEPDPAPPADARAPRPGRPSVVAEPTGLARSSEELPLRYTGSVGGVDIEVRGRPVMVSEDKGARVLVIEVAGVWIRIRVPAEPGRDGHN